MTLPILRFIEPKPGVLVVRKSSLFVAVAIVLSVVAPSFGAAEARPFFTDSFESGDRSHSENGFVWGGSDRVGRKVYVSSDVAHTGSNSLCFMYTGKPLGQDSSAEQRFLLGRRVRELWVRYFIFFPRNYFHRDDRPSNNKLFYLWGGDYQDSDNYVSFHTRSTGEDGNSNLSWVPFNRRPHPLARQPKIEFVNRRRDLGRWMEVVLHWRRQSTQDATDGVIQLWQRPANASSYTALVDERSSNLTWGKGSNLIDRGYIFGWSNSGFSRDTQICIDDIQFSETPIVPSLR